MSNEQETITKIGPLTPVFETPELVQQNIKKFRETCHQILDPKIDLATINGKIFIRKSGWNVLNQYFGVQTIPIKSWRTELEDNEYMLTVVVQTSFNGIIGPARSASCTSIEMKEKHGNKSYLGMDSHCYGMAETRAVGRASAAWFMVGDPSAEEMDNSPSNFSNTSDVKTCLCTPKQRELSNDTKSCKNCGKLFSTLVLECLLTNKKQSGDKK